MIVLEAHGRESGHAGWRGGRRAVMAAGAVAVFVFAVACGGSTKSAAPAGPVVDVTALDNSWNPDSVTITPGSTVKWTNKGKLDHNIIPNGGDTKFGVDTANFGPGKTHEFTFAKAGEYKYYCSLHGTADAGMVGKIVVTDAPTTANTGTTAKTSGTRPGNEPGEIRKVPADFKTIQAGVDAAKPGDMVLIDKGVYHEAIKVKTDNIVIRGVDRNDTVLDGEYKLDNGFLVAGANGVAIENMTAKNYAKNGFFWTGVQGYRGSYLTAIRAGDYGVYAFDSRYGQLDHIMGTGSPDAGVYIGQCYPCDALITDVSAEYNGLGYSGT